MKRVAVYLAGCVLAIGCILNPQPHPPEDSGSFGPPDSGIAVGPGGSTAAVDAATLDASAPIVTHGNGDAAATDSENADAAVRADAAADGPPGLTADADAGPAEDADAAYAKDAVDGAPATDGDDSGEWGPRPRRGRPARL
jgi:hypothetical protein